MRCICYGESGISLLWVGWIPFYANFLRSKNVAINFRQKKYLQLVFHRKRLVGITLPKLLLLFLRGWNLPVKSHCGIFFAFENYTASEKSRSILQNRPMDSHSLCGQLVLVTRPTGRDGLPRAAFDVVACRPNYVRVTCLTTGQSRIDEFFIIYKSPVRAAKKCPIY